MPPSFYILRANLFLWSSFFCSYNKYSQVAARAVRSALKEPERIKADKRALVTLKKQIWEKGIPTESVSQTFLLVVEGGRQKKEKQDGKEEEAEEGDWLKVVPSPRCLFLEVSELGLGSNAVEGGELVDVVSVGEGLEGG